MKLSQGLRQSLVQRQEQKLVLTQTQRLAITSHILELRLDLIQVLIGERYNPRGTCPSCLRVLTPMEVIRGFNQDPRDFTTGCPSCKSRFEPSLICISGTSRIELPFYCDAQTLKQLAGKENLTVEELSQKHPAIYRSAIAHHGNIKAAFEKIGVKYAHAEFIEWKNKITSFLGYLPDTVIAECASIPVYKVRAARKRLGIPKFTRQKTLQSIRS